MKTIEVTECKLCGAEYYSSNKEVTLQPNDVIEFITKKVGKCYACKSKKDRTISCNTRR